jgi:hypothetical protein
MRGGVGTFTVALVGVRSRAWYDGVVGDETVALVGVRSRAWYDGVVGDETGTWSMHA